MSNIICSIGGTTGVVQNYQRDSIRFNNNGYNADYLTSTGYTGKPFNQSDGRTTMDYIHGQQYLNTYLFTSDEMIRQGVEHSIKLKVTVLQKYIWF